MATRYYDAVNDWLKGKKNPGLLIAEKSGIRWNQKGFATGEDLISWKNT
jgi:hypothetical protein